MRLFNVLFCICCSWMMCSLFSCASVEAYNKKRDRVISVSKLRADINYVERTLYKRHPDYDYYISKESLRLKFDSLRASIQEPMTQHDFFPKLAGVVSQVRQGHMGVHPAKRKLSKDRKHFLRSKVGSPFQLFDYLWEDQRLYLIGNRSGDSSIQLGTELIAVNGITIGSLYQKYHRTFTGDGYITTADKYFFAKRVPSLLLEELGPLDSLEYSFAHEGEAFDKTLGYIPIRNQVDANLTKADSLLAIRRKQDIDISTLNWAVAIRDSVDKAQDSTTKVRSLHGWDRKNKQLVRRLKFEGKDSAVALLNITGFSNGPFKKSYQDIFAQIDSAGATTLVLDLRGNPGGRASEIVELFRYFADSSFKMYVPSKVGSKTSLLRAGFYKKIPIAVWPFFSLYYPFYAMHRFVNTRKYDDGAYYNTGMAGHRWKTPHSNAFKGKIYVLIDGGSFSASCLFASQLHQLDRVTFVGEETGGDFNGTVAGIMPMDKLRHSKLLWRYGLMQIGPTHQTRIKGRGIIPNVSFVKKVDEYVKGTDEAMDWIRKEQGLK